jgi:hypothetical protein
LERTQEEGTTFLKWLLAQRQFADLPILVLSAHADLREQVSRMASPRITVTAKRAGNFRQVQTILRSFVERAREKRASG